MKIRRFKLSDSFIEPYQTREVPWGYNGLGYVTYKRTYARRLDETEPGAQGTEEWWQTCRRVIEGMFSIQKKHVQELGLDWNDAKAQRTAKEAYERMFVMKWLPPGRGLWMLGTDFIENRTGAGAFNCAFRSTRELASKGGYLFAWIMDALMLGIGVGFDTLGAGTIVIKQPGTVPVPSNYFDTLTINRANDVGNPGYTIHIADSREGWVESVQALLDSFYYGYQTPQFDYSGIRSIGAPIKGFGGVCSGSGPLELLHQELTQLYTARIGSPITSVDITDTENLIGKCVVSGNVRRSAALALGAADDFDFLTMKNDKAKLMSHRWGSNNSFNAQIGMDYQWHAGQCQLNGEPAPIWLWNARHYGRLKDGLRFDDLKVMGFNPCVEQQLEDGELCCLTETFPAKHDTLEDYLASLKLAYLYAKSITLLRTHWKETNAVMQKNRRIGLSQSGVVQAISKHGYHTMTQWCDRGYEYVQELDAIYSDWLCVPRSKRTTSVKPSGTVSLLNGSTPGIHFPEDEYYIRRVRFAADSDLLPALGIAGYESS